MKTIFEDNLVSLTNTYTAFSDTTTFRNRPILLSQATVHLSHESDIAGLLDGQTQPPVIG